MNHNTGIWNFQFSFPYFLLEKNCSWENWEMNRNNTICLSGVNSSTVQNKQRQREWRVKILILCPSSMLYHPYHKKIYQTIIAKVYGLNNYLMDYGKLFFEYCHPIQKQGLCMLRWNVFLYLGMENYWILMAIPAIPYDNNLLIRDWHLRKCCSI